MTKRTILLRMAICGAVCTALAVSCVARAAETNAALADPSSKSLDDQLLQGLDHSLDDKLPGGKLPPANQGAEPQNADSQSATDGKPAMRSSSDKKLSEQFSPFDEALRKRMSGGDDAEGSREKDSLAQIVVQMRQVEQRLAASKSDHLTQQEQQRIADELKSLVDQMMKHQCQCQCQCSGGECNKQGTSRGTPKPGNGGSGKTPAGEPNNKPARNSTPRLAKSQSSQADALAQRDMLVKELDRLHLPERDREEMKQAPLDQFLPGHEASIGEYFKRLMEQDEEK